MVDKIIKYLTKIKEELEERCNIKFDFKQEDLISYLKEWDINSFGKYLVEALEEVNIIPDLLDFRNRKFKLIVCYYDTIYDVVIDIKNEEIEKVTKIVGEDNFDLWDFIILSGIYIEYLNNLYHVTLKEKISDHLNELFE